MQATPPARHAFTASPLSVPPASPSPSKSRFFSIPRSSSPRPSQAQQVAMGHSQSTQAGRPTSPPLPPTPAAEVPLQMTSQPQAQSSRPKFAWPGRRKKSEDMGRILGNGTPSPPGTVGKGKGRETVRSDTFMSDYESPGSSTSHELPLARTQSRQTSAKQLTIQFANALKGKIINASSTSLSSPRSPAFSPNNSAPPPLPPKSENARFSLSGRSRSSAESSRPFVLTNEKRVSMQKPLPSTAPPATLADQAQTQPFDSEIRSDHHHAVGRLVSSVPISVKAYDDVKHQGHGSLLQGQAEGQGLESPRRREKREDMEAQTAREIVEDWRKSDSTLRTVRLVGAGQRTPRPLSLAESTNSNQTVLPGAGSPGASASLTAVAAKRNSLLIDADFGMAEVESEDSDDGMDEVVFPRNNIPGSYQAYGVTASVESVNTSNRPPSAWQIAGRSRSPSPPPTTATSTKNSRRGSLTFRIGRFSSSPAADRTPAPVPTDHLSGSDSEAMSSLSASTHSHNRTPSSSTTSVSFSSSSPGSGIGQDNAMNPTVGIVSSTSTGSDYSHGITQNMQQQQHQFEWAKHQALGSSTSLSTSNSSHGRRPSQDTTHGSESESVHSQSLSTMSHPSQVSYASQPITMRPAQQRSRLASINSKGFRQTAVSLTSGLAPAAGFAKGVGKRIGRALGGSVTNVSIIPMSDQETYGHGHSQSTIIGRSQSSVEQHVHAQSQSQGFFGMHQSRYGPGNAQGPPLPKKNKGKHASTASASTHSRPSFSDSDAAPRVHGPNLGRLVRPPLGGSGTRLVFGRDLAECVRDTAVGVGVPGWESYVKKERTSTFSMDMEVVGAKALEGRKLPALVMRCAQHIEKWGVQEEGLFRISGRSTHMQRLRVEFDSGADFDMSECGPGEIDPHAVASIFKAYLRELPEPILTRRLIPYFDAALSAENSMMNARDEKAHSIDRPRGPGLPTSPTRGNVKAQVRKAPSLSTFSASVPAPRAPSENLLNALSSLIARLPRENRDLLRTLAELMRVTARRVKETKMPLTNLILIFCPTLQMSGTLLRVLCESEGIWDGPPKGAEDPVVLDIKGEKAELASLIDIRAPSPLPLEAHGTGTSELGRSADLSVSSAPNVSEEEEHDEAEHADAENEPALKSQKTIRRAKRASHTLSEDANKQGSGSPVETDDISESSSSPNDGQSSAGAHSKAESLRSGLYSPTAPTASSDSLSTPLSSASASPAKASVSLAHQGVSFHESATIRARSDLPSPSKGSVRKSMIGQPIPFPNDSSSVPNTPIEHPSQFRLSTYSSSPNLGAPSSPMRRRSKASLQGLFPKRSLSSLLGRSDRQPATPTSADYETAPQSRVVSSVCPVLELPVSTSPIKFDMGLGLTIEPEPERLVPRRTESGPSRDDDGGDDMSRSSSNSSAVTSTVYYTPPTASRPLPQAPSLSSHSSTGSYSLLDFDIHKDQAAATADWASSVLQAAEVSQHKFKK